MTIIYSASELEQYVGRRFVLKNTRYGALDGAIGYVERIDTMPIWNDEAGTNMTTSCLAVHIPKRKFEHALMLPDQFGREVRTKQP